MSDLDSIFNEFARAFVGTVTDEYEVAFPAHLPRAQLDGTVESLHIVDDYLAYVHKHRKRLSDQDWHFTVLRAGAYVGEVIRHASPAGSVHWLDYNDYMPTQPKLQALIPERTVATCAFLVFSNGFMSMPLNKVARFIGEGKEHSVHFFASCDLNQAAQSRA